MLTLAVFWVALGIIFCCDSFAGLCNDVKHKVDIEVYYVEIVHALYTAACKCIPRVPRSALKHYWSAALDDLNVSSKEAFDTWVICGKLACGAV
jgi:hypothetical protein